MHDALFQPIYMNHLRLLPVRLYLLVAQNAPYH